MLERDKTNPRIDKSLDIQIIERTKTRKRHTLEWTNPARGKTNPRKDVDYKRTNPSINFFDKL